MTRVGLVAVAVLVAGVAVAGMPASAQAHRVAYCKGHLANIVGGPRNNLLRGTRHADVIAAGRGHDVIVGLKGNDIICGGRGADVIDGGSGQDVVYGGYGRDLCVAPTEQEHLLHHNCEVRIGAPPATPTPQSTGIPASPNDGTECSDAACFGGVPVCGSDSRLLGGTPMVAVTAPWPRDDQGVMPIATNLWQNGTIAVSLEVGAYDGFNNLHLVYGPGPIFTYGPLQQNHMVYVVPQPDHIPDPSNSSGAEIVWEWFNDYNPATAQWGGWFWKRATRYQDPPISQNTGVCLNLRGFS